LADWIPPALKSKSAPPAQTVAPDPQAVNLQEVFARVAEKAKPAVVSITTVHVESVQAAPYEFYFGDPFEFFQEFQGGAPRVRRAPPVRRKSQGVGSGVIVDPRGYVLTNEHVVRGADQLTVAVPGVGAGPDRKFPGQVVGSDPRSDLAVIKIKSSDAFTYLALADSDKVRVGDWAIAVGSPFGLEQTVTVGVVSALRQSLNIEGASYSNLLQTDAAINRGNSGGPLINIRGEVMGINTAIYAPTGVFAGIGFAIPANRVKDIMNQLISQGRVVRGWMGVEVMGMNDVSARAFGLADTNGVLVNGVLPGSPAEKAGLRRGDVITAFNGQKIADQESLVDRVSKTPPKTAVKLSIVRDGRARELTLTTGEAPAPSARAEEPGEGPAAPGEEGGASSVWEGASVASLSPALAQRWGLPPGTAGVVVADVAPGSRAESMGLQSGDVIASLNRQSTPTAEQFARVARSADVKKGVLLDVFRQGRWVYLSYRDGQ
jgi:serine protease Do